MTRKVFVECGFCFDVANLPPRSKWVGMKDGERMVNGRPVLSGEPAPQSLRRYCDPMRGVQVAKKPDRFLVCPSFVIGQDVFTTVEAWTAFLKCRQEWRSKRRGK